MRLLVPIEITKRLVDALKHAGEREIGGILMAEHVGSDIFRLKDLTIQQQGGTFSAFVRFVADMLPSLRGFFDRTKHDYTTFNYLGEWHSHHSFALTPSSRDHVTMEEIAFDRTLGAKFVVLLLVKLGTKDQLESSLTVYQSGKLPFCGEIVQDA